MKFLSKHIRDCIDACYKTVAACERCADATENPVTQELARECADIAALCLRFLDRQSALTSDLATACIKACRAAAEACRGDTAAESRECTEVTRHCASVLSENILVLEAFKKARTKVHEEVAH